MKSLAYNACQHNLKGKKTKRLRCGCCTMTNFNDKVINERHRKEMRDAMKCLTDMDR